MRLMRILVLLLPLFAWGIDVRTNIKEVHHEGCCEQIGSFSLVVNENALASASSTNPIYIRFRIVQAHGWSKTLVDLRPGADSGSQVPINLSLRNDGSASIADDLPSSAVQLVRLIEGERDGWIRVNVSSSLWLFEEGSHTSPSSGNSTSFSLGISGLNSVSFPSSTTSNGNEYDDVAGFLASTILCANYKNTPEFGPGDMDMLDFISFDSSTIGVETEDVVLPGLNTGVTFSNDTDIARGAHFIACFSMSQSPDSFEETPHEIVFSTLSTFDLSTSREKIQPVYVRNCSDYEWHPGSRFYFCIISHKLFGDSFYETNSTLSDTIYFNQPNLTVTPFSDETWQVDAFYDGEKITGYRLTLLDGEFPIDGSLKIEDLSLTLDHDYEEGGPVDIYLYADLTHPTVTDGNLYRFGAFISHMATWTYQEPILYHRVVPYTGYDQPNWEFSLRSINPNTQSARLTNFLSNRHGLLLRVDGGQEIPAMGTYEFSIVERFGEEADQVLAWVDQYSDQPFFSTGILHDPEKEVFEVIASREKSYRKLIAPHITASSEWQTTAYILASGGDSPRFFFSSTADDNEHISAIRYPGATAVYTDKDFINEQSKITWFQVNAEVSTANGQIFYYQENSSGQLTSLPLGTAPVVDWSFDHLGKSENDWWNGLVMNNPSLISTQCTLTLMDENAENLETATIQIDPESREALLLKDVFNEFENLPGSRLSIHSDEPIVAFLLMGMEEKDQLSDVPGNLQVGGELVLPFMNFSAGFWTGLVITNTNAQAGTFYFEAFSKTGEMKKSTLIDLPANGKMVFQPNTYLDDLQEYEFMIIHATREIRGFALIGNKRQTELASLPLIPVP